MALVDLSFAPFRRALVQPFQYGNRTLSEREGIALRIESSTGPVFSEASPLPGHSKERVPEILQWLKENRSGLRALAEDIRGCPLAMRFALEGLRAQQSPFLSPVRSNALLPWEDLESSLKRAQELGRRGFRCLKLKLRSGRIKETLSLLSALQGTDFCFRLDGNQALTEADLGELFGDLDAGRVEYLEEPLPTWNSALLAESPVPLAADESAADPVQWPALMDKAAVFVLKPSVSGGLFSLANQAKDLQDGGKKVVYGSAMEAEPGRRAILAFLASLRSPATAGLATGFLFRENFLPDAAEITAIPPPSAAELAWLSSLPWETL